MTKKTGIRLWNEAKTIIPGGNQLLSKRVERFLPGEWPAYYTKAKGCQIWDLDGNRYYDFAQMGVGSCALGYADEDVNRAVISAIRDGSMATLNCYEEVELAKKLIKIHPWADSVKFARTGGEACAIAIRIARAAAGRSKIAFCGYHGWHDWYLSANIANSNNLDEQLLPGLAPLGVPFELKGSAIPFNYNKLSELENIIKSNPKQIGVIIMEPMRSIYPEPGFLEGVRKIADRIGAILIFDEVTSGFRLNLGGIHLVFGVKPDIAVFGKALGNGFPITAVIGKKKIMDFAQRTFVSSTFWTERIGFVAALATLRKMAEKKVQKKLVYFGERINAGWKKLARKHNLGITISGIPPLTHISFKNNVPLETQTLYAQEMLEQGFLVSSSVYATYAYTDELIDKFIFHSDRAFAKIRKALDSTEIKRFLKNDVIQEGFKRLA
ncbi:MAG: aminotransferase class III-fold pyridoxal phosphate-dependent enzyme [Candidatus Omnitrophica bacterium]|nr:aminotransferase class III-fold pyridoxal phosphate-dependent enzyme [Candidatus Omnitrophota bacterium]